ncbi:MAG: AsnC family transcriptional regulator [Candidatus Rokuibacteriota bacterium]|nr:MAG: AsnC family transcriptional regulator [Candidatus Rokubacteria bacterium]
MAAKTRARVKAYVLIETAAGKTKSVKTGLGRLKGSTAGLVNLDAVTGPYDFIAVIEGSTLDALGRLVTDGIGAIDGVTRTTTCVAVTVG